MLQLVFLLALNHWLHESDQIAMHEYHSKEVVGRTNWLDASLSKGVLSWLGYTLTGESCYSGLINTYNQRCLTEINEIGKILTDKAQQETLSEIRRLTQSVFATLNRTKTQPGNQQEKAVQVLESKSVQALTTEFMALRHGFLSRELNDSKLGTDATKENRVMLQGLVPIGFSLTAVLAFAILIVFSKGVAKRLAVLTDNTYKLAKDEPLNPVMAGSDEISRLDRTFHDMAEKLKEAAERERELSDAKQENSGHG